MDEHNGRFYITPEYPNGAYAYFATVDEYWNSVYPYVFEPTFYRVATNRIVRSLDKPTTIQELYD
ncbi:YHYH protein [Brumimicrobium mesophilum]|uniref:YHYH protein n=1 Tax=Brumimicrobium mesophilum TaxID=392717 RepID=UPI000D13FB42|nr:YHYH protein [Brumimicrobium mesophilum]